MLGAITGAQGRGHRGGGHSFAYIQAKADKEEKNKAAAAKKKEKEQREAVAALPKEKKVEGAAKLLAGKAHKVSEEKEKYRCVYGGSAGPHFFKGGKLVPDKEVGLARRILQPCHTATTRELELLKGKTNGHSNGVTSLRRSARLASKTSPVKSGPRENTKKKSPTRRAK